MKTFKQFIKEEELENIATILKRDCMPFLKAGGYGYIQRGIKNLASADAERVMIGDLETVMYKKNVRTDRQPRDTKKPMHDLIDGWFKRTFGIHARSEAVFCFGMGASYRTMRQYGEPCMIFPIGDFSFVWSPHVDDLLNSIDSISTTTTSDWAEGHDLDKFEQFMKDLGYKDTHFKQAIDGGVEIMIKCGAYYAVSLDYEENLKQMMEKEL